MSTMKVYKCYQVYGYKEAFFWQPLKTHPYNWDDWQKDCVVPYLVDTDPTDPKNVHRILLDVVQEGDTDEMD